MPFLAPIFGAIASGVSGLVTLAGGIKAVLGIVLNLAFTLLSMLMRPKAPKPHENLAVFRQAAPVRFKYLGYVKAGGVALTLQVYKRVLYVVTCYGEGPWDYEQFYVDQRPVVVDKEGVITSEPYADKNPAMRLWSLPGRTPGTAYATLIKDLPTLYTVDHRYDGLATSLVRGRAVSPQYAAMIYPNIFPSVVAVGRAGECFDPRTGQTQFTKNLVLHLRHYLTSPDGAGIPEALIDDDVDWKLAASVADELLQTKSGGTVRRYEGSTQWKFDEKIGDVIDRLLFPIAGRLYLKPSNGKVGIKVGHKWIAPKVHITDADIIEHTIRAGSTPIQEAGEIVIKWTDPLTEFGERTSQPWRNETVIKRSMGAVRTHAFEAYGIQSHNHARRIAKILDSKLNPEFQGTIRTTLVGLKAMDDQYIYVDLDDYDRYMVPMELLSWAVEGPMVSMRVSSVDPGMFDFDPVTEEGDPPVIPLTASPSELVEISDFRVQAVRNSNGVTLVLRVKAPPKVDHSGEDDEGKDSQNREILTEFQWAPADSDEWIQAGGPAMTISCRVSGITERGPYDVRARHIGTSGVPSAWVIIENIDITESTATPPVVTDTTIGVSAANEITFTCKTPKSAAFQGIRIYTSTSNNAANADPLNTHYLPVDQTVSVVNTLEPGKYYVFVSSINWAAKESKRLLVTPTPITV